MSTDLPTESSPSDAEDRLFPNLPRSYNGWVRYDQSDSVFEYWRCGSNHVVGTIEQIVARPRTRKEEIYLCEHTYDQFGHTLNTKTILSKSPDRSDWIWKRAREEMDRFPGNGAFERPPEMPTKIGDWELTRKKSDQRANMTVWEQGFGQAKIIVEEGDIRCSYGGCNRPQTVRYSEVDCDPYEIISGVSRTFAYEIATNTLSEMGNPLSECDAALKRLQDLKGIGPAKSRKLVLLGITSPDDLAQHIAADSSIVNHYHREAVDKILTSTIRESIDGQLPRLLEESR